MQISRTSLLRFACEQKPSLTVWGPSQKVPRLQSIPSSQMRQGFQSGPSAAIFKVGSPGQKMGLLSLADLETQGR